MQKNETQNAQLSADVVNHPQREGNAHHKAPEPSAGPSAHRDQITLVERSVKKGDLDIVHTSHAPHQPILVFWSAVTQRPRETNVPNWDRSNNFPLDLNL